MGDSYRHKSDKSSRRRSRSRSTSRSREKPRSKDRRRDRSRSQSPRPDRRRARSRSQSPRPARQRAHSRSQSPGLIPPRRDDRVDRRNPNQKNDNNYRGQDRRRDRDRDRDLDSNGRPRDPVREGEWNHFFHPDTVTSSTSSSNPNPRIKKELSEDDKYGIRRGSRGKGDGEGDEAPKVEKEKPNFGLSGKLTAETNTFKGVVIKYSEPPEARKPQRIRWRLYPFKDDEPLPVMYIHRQSAYLLGRDRKIADIPIDHPSCSKQHAAIQYRLMPYERANGTKGRRIKPYVIDLESANGTLINGTKIEPKRYVELFEKDVLKFGFSSREYILLHENSKDDPDDDEETLGTASPLPAIKQEKLD